MPVQTLSAVTTSSPSIKNVAPSNLKVSCVDGHNILVRRTVLQYVFFLSLDAKSTFHTISPKLVVLYSNTVSFIINKSYKFPQ